MTNIRKEARGHFSRSARLSIGIGILTLSLAGCGAGDALNNIGLAISGSDNSSSSSTSSTNIASNNVQTITPIALAPVFGPPVKVAQKLSGALESEAQVRSIKVVKDKNTKPGYTVRGYLSASPTKNGTKLSYIWDVTNPSGKRAHRIKGEELVSGQLNSNDPWASIDQTAIQSIASKTATRLANWLPKGKQGSNLIRQASLQNNTAPIKYSGPLIASVPVIKGAPGDGSKSLAVALRKQLKNKNIKVASANASSATYKVIGIVNLTAPVQGKQNIKIQWVVRDPNNRKLGTVSQKNTIPSGSLDGAWGKTADAAASAAANGIIKLLKN